MAIRLGKVAGIPIELDYSLIVIFVLIVWSVGFVSMPAAYPGLGLAAYLVIGALSAVLLLGSILVHELAHSIVAKRNGLKIRRVTLYLLGGVSEMEEEPANPSLELRVSAAGPLTSVALTVVLAVLWGLSVSLRTSPLVQAPLEYAAVVNGIVAGFNLIPAFPMDGGRILRAFLWSRNGDLLRSTKTASNVGRGFAYFIIFGGFFLLVFSGDLLTGLWLILIGWFISAGAQASLRQMMVQEDLRDLRVSSIMTRKVDSVPPEMTLNDLSLQIQDLKHNGFPVMSDGKLEGCVTAHDLRTVRREMWSKVKVRGVMTPREKLITIREDEPATKVLESMRVNRIGRVFVTNEEGTLVGIVTRSDILKTIQLKEEVSGIGAAAEARGDRISFTVERGMNFVLEQPMSEGFDWMAEFVPNGVQLVSEAVTKTAEGHEVRRFTFQAKSAGTHSIRLVERAEPERRDGRMARGGKAMRRTIVYTILVA